jgi:polar amino acid transport system substrate-binding protein
MKGSEMMKWIRLYVFAIFILFLLSSPRPVCAQELVFSSPEIHEIEGRVTEIITRAYRQLGIDVALLALPAKRSSRSANTGKTDGEAARDAENEQELPNLIRVDVPIRTAPMHLYVRAGEEFSVDGWESIPDGYVLGYRRGVSFVEAAITQYDLTAMANGSEDKLFKQLVSRRLDVVVDNSADADRIIAAQQLKNIVRLDPPVRINVLYHYLHKKHAQLVPEITRVLQAMVDRGELEEIHQRFDARLRDEGFEGANDPSSADGDGL